MCARLRVRTRDPTTFTRLRVRDTRRYSLLFAEGKKIYGKQKKKLALF